MRSSTTTWRWLRIFGFSLYACVLLGFGLLGFGWLQLKGFYKGVSGFVEAYFWSCGASRRSHTGIKVGGFNYQGSGLS